MSRLVEDAGAQLLPRVRDERATFSPFVAEACCSADLRARSTPHREFASRLRVIL